jgi:hypothetical protein
MSYLGEMLGTRHRIVEAPCIVGIQQISLQSKARTMNDCGDHSLDLNLYATCTPLCSPTPGKTNINSPINPISNGPILSRSILSFE